MQLATSTTTPPPAAPTTVVARPGDPGNVGPLREYDLVTMLLRVPGTESVSWHEPARDAYTLNMVNPVFAKLGSAVLRDTIDGAKILFKAEGTLPQPPDAGTGTGPWWERRLHMVKTIATLPGVHDYQFVGRSAVAIHAVNAEAQAALRRVLRDELPDVWHTKVYVVVSGSGPEPN